MPETAPKSAAKKPVSRPTVTVTLEQAESFAELWRGASNLALGHIPVPQPVVNADGSLQVGQNGQPVMRQGEINLALTDEETKALALHTFKTAERLQPYARFVDSALNAGELAGVVLTPAAILGGRLALIRGQLGWVQRAGEYVDKQAAKWDELRGGKRAVGSRPAPPINWRNGNGKDVPGARPADTAPSMGVGRDDEAGYARVVGIQNGRSSGEDQADTKSYTVEAAPKRQRVSKFATESADGDRSGA